MSGGHRKETTVANFVDDLQSSGRYTFAFREAVAACGASVVAARSAIRRLKEKGRIVSPRREFFVVVPVEYRSTGCPPAIWFVDDLMAYLSQSYYVGLLSAAAVHGAAHQQPQVFQVVTSQPTVSMEAGRVRLAFYRKRNIDQVATVRVKTDTGTMAVSSPEATAFDLLRHTRVAGGLSNVATVFAELGEVMGRDAILAAAEVASIPEVQRAGWLLALVGHERLADQLAAFLAARRVRRSLLRPDLDAGNAPMEERWRLVLNEEVEPEQ